MTEFNGLRCPHCGFETGIEPALVDSDAPMLYCKECDKPLFGESAPSPDPIPDTHVGGFRPVKASHRLPPIDVRVISRRLESIGKSRYAYSQIETDGIGVYEGVNYCRIGSESYDEWIAGVEWLEECILPAEAHVGEDEYLNYLRNEKSDLEAKKLSEFGKGGYHYISCALEEYRRLHPQPKEPGEARRNIPEDMDEWCEAHQEYYKDECPQCATLESREMASEAGMSQRDFDKQQKTAREEPREKALPAKKFESRDDYEEWIYKIIQDEMGDGNNRSLAYRLAFEFDSYIRMVYESEPKALPVEEVPSRKSIWDAWEDFEKANIEYFSGPVPDGGAYLGKNIRKNYRVIQRASAEWGARWMRQSLEKELSTLRAQLEEEKLLSNTFRTKLEDIDKLYQQTYIQDEWMDKKLSSINLLLDKHREVKNA